MSKLTDKDRNKARIAAIALDGFHWEYTPQGDAYWADIHEQLEAIATPPKLECWANVREGLTSPLFYQNKADALKVIRGRDENYTRIAVHMREV